MAEKEEIAALAKKIGMSEEYAASMLAFQENYAKQKEEVAPMAEALGMTPEEYISEMDQQRIHLSFLSSKGFDVKSQRGLADAKAWVTAANPDDLMLGDPNGDEFDIIMGEMRRGTLLKAIEREMRKC